MTRTIFSLKALGICWAGLLVALGSGAMALQLTAPVPVAPPPPIAVAQVIPPAPAPAAAPVPFENRSLLAMLPPPSHPAPRPEAPLPLPPVPPVRHLARLEPPHRPVTVYAAEPAYAAPDWGRPVPYPGLYARAQLYSYPGPRTYYGW